MAGDWLQLRQREPISYKECNVHRVNPALQLVALVTSRRQDPVQVVPDDLRLS